MLDEAAHLAIAAAATVFAPPPLGLTEEKLKGSTALKRIIADGPKWAMFSAVRRVLLINVILVVLRFNPKKA